ncbi:MAG: histidine kinase, partial [Microbacterium sp.]|nr:histidine kinase [Microbacterium sp.]
AASVLAALDELHLGPGEVELALDPDLPSVRADGVLLQRVIVNVLANAHRHAPAGSRVRVATSRLGGIAEIRIIDHGVGVPSDRRDDMFAPFQRMGDRGWASAWPCPAGSPRGWAERSPPKTPRAAASPW